MEITKIERMSFEAQRGWGALYYHVITGIINKKKYKQILEIGVAFGCHAEHILKNTTANITCIDQYKPYYGSWDGIQTEQDFNELYEFAKERLVGNRCELIRASSIDAFDLVKGEKYDLVFIDAQHDYDWVKKEISLYLPLINKGGTLSGHDYNREGYAGVCEAVDEFVKESGKELVLYDGYVWSVQL
jgi:predicted O-methyltransferase YrrM